MTCNLSKANLNNIKYEYLPTYTTTRYFYTNKNINLIKIRSFATLFNLQNITINSNHDTSKRRKKIAKSPFDIAN